MEGTCEMNRSTTSSNPAPVGPTSKETIKQQFRQNISQGFLTLISIVLGVALAVEAQRLSELIPQAPQLSEWLWYVDTSIQALTAFLMISGTFYLYYNVFSSVPFPPNYYQVMLPFLVGISVVLVAYMIGRERLFWYSADVVYVIACVTFLNTLSVLGKNVYASDAKEIYNLVRSQQYSTLAVFSTMTLFTSGFLIFAPQYFQRWNTVILFSGNAVIYLIGVWRTEVFLRRVYIELNKQSAPT
jgi:hypothetical protein